jgi:hypothetical protein
MDDDRAMRRVLIAAAAAVLLAAAPASASSARATVGISDQEAGTYLDPLLAWTGIAQARVILPWTSRSTLTRAASTAFSRPRTGPT